MRIRIRRPIAGVIDGVSLSHFEPGLSYEVTDSLGGYLVSTGDAEAAPATVQIEPVEEPSDYRAFGGIVIAPSRDDAADKPRPLAGRRKRD